MGKKKPSAIAEMLRTTVDEGGRNDHLYKLACMIFKARGITDKGINAVHVYNSSKCNPPLAESEVSRLIESAKTFYYEKVLKNPDYKPPSAKPEEDSGALDWGDAIDDGMPPEDDAEAPPDQASAGDGRPEKKESPPADYSADYKTYSSYLDSSIGKEGAAYLAQRGISLELALSCGIGFEPAWRSPKAEAEGKFPPVSPRLIIPVNNGSYIAIDTRVHAHPNFRRLWEGKSAVWLGRDAEPDQAACARGVYNDFWRGHDVLSKDIVFITEGIFDALAIMEAGQAAISLNSTNNVGAFISKIAGREKLPLFILALDKDSAGEEATKKLQSMLTKMHVKSIVADLSGDYNDPNEFLTHDRDGFMRQVSLTLSLDHTKPDGMNSYINSFLKADLAKHMTAANVKTGFWNLDAKCGNLYAGLYVIAAISSLGKTTLCHQMADNIAASGNSVLFFSLEQSRLELLTKSVNRLLALKCGPEHHAIDALYIRNGLWQHEPAEYDAVLGAIEEYQEMVGDRLNIIEGNMACNVEFIRDYVKRYISTTGERPVVIIDYLQILVPVDSDDKNKQSIVAYSVAELKRLSRDYSIPVIMISSVNRMNYLTPIDFESLKHAGEIEYSCDVVWGMQLNCIHDKLFGQDEHKGAKRAAIKAAKKADPREIELVCLKNRYGESSYNCYFEYYAKCDVVTPVKYFKPHEAQGDEKGDGRE